MKPFRLSPKQCRSIPVIGKVAVVTGASSGIGAETARYLAANMATVVVHGRNRDKLNKVAASVEAAGLGAAGVLVGSAVLATLMPAAKASRLDVLQALRPE